MPNELQGLLGGMQATPRNKLMGLLADGLKAADRYANKPDPTMPGGKANPPLSLLSDLASLKSLAEVANNVSYGYPLTNAGVANVPFLKPETADALMMAPISPRNALAAAALAGGGDTAAMKAIFAGIGAKTADKAALARAEKLAASGADPKAIWRDTGWFKGGDGKWRFEIDDAGFKVNDWRGTGGAISPKHPGLDDAYDGANRIKVRSDDRLGAGTMAYSPWKDSLDFRMGDHGSIVYKPGETPPTDAWLHELQHYVQEREGFAKGGSANGFIESSGSISGTKLAPEAQAIFDSGLWDGMPKMGSDEIAFRQQAAIQEAYKNLAGEAEARAVQKRMNMNPQQRRELFPLDSFDVPANSLIYR